MVIIFLKLWKIDAHQSVHLADSAKINLFTISPDFVHIPKLDAFQENKYLFFIMPLIKRLHSLEFASAIFVVVPNH